MFTVARDAATLSFLALSVARPAATSIVTVPVLPSAVVGVRVILYRRGPFILVFQLLAFVAPPTARSPTTKSDTGSPKSIVTSNAPFCGVVGAAIVVETVSVRSCLYEYYSWQSRLFGIAEKDETRGFAHFPIASSGISQHRAFT